MTGGPLTEDDKRELCAWRYEGAYALYNLPPYEELRGAKRGFMDPRREADYRGFRVDGQLTGYVHIIEGPDGISIGIGVRPDCCGKGHGCRILKETCQALRARFPGKPLVLAVRTWNLRAIRCYQKAGFRAEGGPYEAVTPCGRGEFIRMVWDGRP